MKINFEKYADGLVPAIVQDVETQKVLMLGFMNAEAFELTQKLGKVTFFSRTRQRIWTKGETSGNFLEVKKILSDCDGDTLLIKAIPAGAICHTGADTCFDEINEAENFLFDLEKIILNRKNNFSENSHTSKLFGKGINKIAQKVGEEAVELVIEAKDDDDALFRNEAADLLYHLMVLLAAKNVSLSEVLQVLENRRK
ncbi:MAG: bifunctional phosphoribosyl-AMP cyclohydrolase/phosphoribosyl-ATP diphosphatase HisIE [Pyrinomonadaceae bacterium]